MNYKIKAQDIDNLYAGYLSWYNNMNESLDALQRAIDGLYNDTDLFCGEGAQAIKENFKCKHGYIVRAFQECIEALDTAYKCEFMGQYFGGVVNEERDSQVPKEKIDSFKDWVKGQHSDSWNCASSAVNEAVNALPYWFQVDAPTKHKDIERKLLEAHDCARKFDESVSQLDEAADQMFRHGNGSFDFGSQLNNLGLYIEQETNGAGEITSFSREAFFNDELAISLIEQATQMDLYEEEHSDSEVSILNEFQERCVARIDEENERLSEEKIRWDAGGTILEWTAPLVEGAVAAIFGLEETIAIVLWKFAPFFASEAVGGLLGSAVGLNIDAAVDGLFEKPGKRLATFMTGLAKGLTGWDLEAIADTALDEGKVLDYVQVGLEGVTEVFSEKVLESHGSGVALCAASTVMVGSLAAMPYKDGAEECRQNSTRCQASIDANNDKKQQVSNDVSKAKSRSKSKSGTSESSSKQKAVSAK